MVKNVLSHYMVMNHRATVYIPVTDGLENKEHDALHFMSSLFGGASSESVKGSYLSKNGEMMYDDVKKVYSYSSGFASEDIDLFLNFARKLRKDLKQESIGIEVDNNFYLIDD